MLPVPPPQPHWSPAIWTHLVPLNLRPHSLLRVQSHAKVVTPQKLCPWVVTRQAHWLPAPS
jgi:hypothetical protein